MSINRTMALGLMIILSGLASNADAKEDYRTHWETINTGLKQSGVVYDGLSNSVQKEECGFASCEKVCYDRSGTNIGPERCNSIWNWVSKDAKNVMGLKRDLDIRSSCTELTKKCLKEDEQILEKLRKARADLDTVPNDIKTNLEEFYAHVLSKIDKDVQTQSDRVARIAGADARIAKIKSKMQSKECRIYQIDADLCRKVQIESNASAGLKAEEDITKETGMVNRYSRYKLGQMKVMHGTADIPNLKKEYKKLSGRDWSKKSCEAESSQSYKDKDGNSISEELYLCGCEMDFSSESSCSNEVR